MDSGVFALLYHFHAGIVQLSSLINIPRINHPITITADKPVEIRLLVMSESYQQFDWPRLSFPVVISSKREPARQQ
jgi:hypothetical protein